MRFPPFFAMNSATIIAKAEIKIKRRTLDLREKRPYNETELEG
jgi:hypothetical protein